MIKLISLRYKNFMSVGNNFMDLTFEGNLSTLYTGKNGSGKSTAGSALNYALFGKTERKIKKGQIINNINGKDCQVELVFSKGKDTYRVFRTLNPGSTSDIFEIYKNEVLIPIIKPVSEYQLLLEDIIGCYFSLWCRLVYLCKTNFVPFLQLEPKHRREFIETLLDLEVFSKMAEVIKKQVTDNTTEVKSLESAISHRKTVISQLEAKFTIDVTNYEAKTARLKGNIAHIDTVKREELRKEKEASIKKLEGSLFEIEQNFSADHDRKMKIVSDSIVNYVKELTEFEDVTKETFELLSSQSKQASENMREFIFENHAACERLDTLKNEGVKLSKELKELEANPNCPTCGQAMTDSHHKVIEDMRLKLTAKREEYAAHKKIADAIADKRPTFMNADLEATKALENFKQREALKQRKSNDLETLRREYDLLAASDIMKIKQEKIDMINQRIAELNKDDGKIDFELGILRRELSEHTSSVPSRDFIENQQNELNVLNDKYDTILKEKAYLDYMTKMLKDEGMKAIVIKKYIPYLNQKINTYLEQLGLFLHFDMDENFDEVLKYEYRHDYSYYNLSEGERQRVDLAMMFAFRDIASVKNVSMFNLFIMDDMTGALDDVGVNNIIDLLHAKDDNTKIVMISHDEDSYGDIFDEVIRFYKKGGFSQMEKLC